ncbi:protein transport protein SFT2-like [Anneissia japonica]|uniref:protein transport protein SFT2-like n=1 Tax=Anneissia japonica TaxID=1529436 RepID=UPI0014259555|nr:protein transport protein SFT2-like [Anneissia japonica]
MSGGINSQLQDYLSNSKKGSQSPTQSSSLHSVKSWMSFGNSKESSARDQDNGNDNGWYTQAADDPFCPTLSKRQRFLGFFTLLLMGVFCFVMAGFIAPFIVLKSRKFALLYTMGSLFTISSFSLLWGPWAHLKHLCSIQRLPFTVAYFGTMTATLYFAMVTKSAGLTSICAICQVIALCWYIISYIPGGQTGLTFFTKLFSAAAGKAVSKTLPV